MCCRPGNKDISPVTFRAWLYCLLSCAPFAERSGAGVYARSGRGGRRGRWIDPSGRGGKRVGGTARASEASAGGGRDGARTRETYPGTCASHLAGSLFVVAARTRACFECRVRVGGEWGAVVAENRARPRGLLRNWARRRERRSGFDVDRHLDRRAFPFRFGIFRFPFDFPDGFARRVGFARSCHGRLLPPSAFFSFPSVASRAFASRARTARDARRLTRTRRRHIARERHARASPARETSRRTRSRRSYATLRTAPRQLSEIPTVPGRRPPACRRRRARASGPSPPPP